ncbi:Taxadien-5-alpha-ol O-acetyltransferase [Heracleum sosnowskyi]|uniref:Taxadien-5-alpha-ol O-acetyltransferase n=1 Tax=Heracleum sosnowskyi TaxID=360622 RepID=A0AAD8HCH5_9APIA|nr:Taxadien-5-alpha-ol O-acetyltransferase [Heracleum sosnowskyi]
MAISVQVKEMSLITPSDTTPTHILPLSSLDSQLFLRFTIEYLLLYNLVPGSDRSATTDALKRALSRALVPYYPLSGRVQTRPDDSGLQVDCRAQGAIFVEAVASGSYLSDFESEPSFVTERRKFLSLCVTDVLNGAPPLVMQLTWLADGAVALGVGFSHCICDGIGSAEFLNSFGELAKLGDFKGKPVWQRHLLDSTSQSHASCIDSVTHPEFNRVSDLCMFDSRFVEEKLTPTSVTFDKKSINELKKLAKIPGQNGESSSYTSFEVLSAHIWKAWATSLNLPPNQIIKLLFSINFRKRVEPSLPNGFYGNAIVLGCAHTTVKDITKKGLGYVTKLVKQAKEKVGNEYVREVVDLVSHTRACPDSVGVLILSQWSKLGLDRVDFGMGRPVQVGPICTDRYCLLLPVADRKDAVKVMLAVPSYGVDKYKSLLRSNLV